MFISQKHIPRRTVLRGLGASLALPLLDGMVPAYAALRKTAANPCAVWAPSTCRTGWRCAPGRRRATGRELRALADSAAAGAVPQPDECTDRAGRQGGRPAAGRRHRRPRACVRHLPDRRPREEDRGCSTSAPASRWTRLPRAQLGAETQLASLELGVDSVETLGACDAGYSCAYTNTIAWRTATTPLPMENDPRAVFERLFGSTDSTDVAAQTPRASGRTAASSTTWATAWPASSRRSDPATAPSSTSTSTPCATSSAASRWPRNKATGRFPAVRAAGRHPRHVRGAFPAHVRPAGAGVPDRHDAGRHVHAEPRGERPRLPRDWRARLAPRLLAPPERPGQAGEAGQDQHVPHAAVRLLPRQAASRRRTATERCWTTRC